MREKPLTIKDLLEYCQEEIQNGHGDCSIMISDDDEGNGYHYLWYSFSNVEDTMMAEEMDYCIDEDIAPKDKTIILG